MAVGGWGVADLAAAGPVSTTIDEVDALNEELRADLGVRELGLLKLFVLLPIALTLGAVVAQVGMALDDSLRARAAGRQGQLAFSPGTSLWAPSTAAEAASPASSAADPGQQAPPRTKPLAFGGDAELVLASAEPMLVPTRQAPALALPAVGPGWLAAREAARIGTPATLHGIDPTRTAVEEPSSTWRRAQRGRPP